MTASHLLGRPLYLLALGAGAQRGGVVTVVLVVSVRYF